MQRKNGRPGQGIALVVFLCACGTTNGVKSNASPVTPKGVAGPVTLDKKLENGFFRYTLPRADGSQLVLFGGHDKLGKKDSLPLLVVVSGSGCGSVFKKRKDGTLKSGLPGMFYQIVHKKLSVVALEKRGVKLGDRQAGVGTHCSKAYHQHAGLDSRVADSTCWPFRLSSNTTRR
ncbi:MAG: hypothetical protein JRH20_21755 [Deltaproteobacteria bacterium]|nr:hypothetical protein [Deltaproteobacteria bacterium]